MFDCWVAPTKTRKLIDFSWFFKMNFPTGCVFELRSHGVKNALQWDWSPKIPNIQRSKNLCASQNSSGKIRPTGGSFGSKKIATLRNSRDQNLLHFPAIRGWSLKQAWAIPWLVESDRQCYLKIAASSHGIQKSEICQAEKQTHGIPWAPEFVRCWGASHVGS